MGTRLSLATTELVIPNDWRMRMEPRINCRVELVLHIEGVVETGISGRRWHGRWFEVTRLSD